MGILNNRDNAAIIFDRFAGALALLDINRDVDYGLLLQLAEDGITSTANDVPEKVVWRGFKALVEFRRRETMTCDQCHQEKPLRLIPIAENEYITLCHECHDRKRDGSYRWDHWKPANFEE